MILCKDIGHFKLWPVSQSGPMTLQRLQSKRRVEWDGWEPAATSSGWLFPRVLGQPSELLTKDIERTE
jgi:hypothetical protein